VDRVLFHGTGHTPTSEILTDFFKVGKSNQNAVGIYFTEDLDSTWIYGSETKTNKEKNRRNINVPNPGQCLTFIAAALYYDKQGFKRVRGYEGNPQQNQIYFAYSHTDKLTTVKEEYPDKSRFYGTEYVVPGIEEQICPFLSIKLKREEYCIIWKDENFSKEVIHNNQYDPIFKKYLKERMDFINKCSKYNVYTCKSPKEALELIKRKRYNKIILISNCCPNGEGKYFVDEARKLIGKEIITLFSAYNKSHLNWIKNMNNALFSNEFKFLEKFIECFYEQDCLKKLKELIDEMELFYNVKFKITESQMIDYPWYNNALNSTFGQLTF
jgi:hypothetical protein